MTLPFRSLFLALGLAVIAFVASAAAQNDTGLPPDKGLPVEVQLGIAFVDISGFDENKGQFSATIDIRARWDDLRLSDPSAPAGAPPQTLIGDAAREKMKSIWVPPLVIANADGEPSQSDYGLRIYPTGRMELMHRVTGNFAVDIDLNRFPFDRQDLPVRVRVKDYPVGQVALRITQPDIEFSRPSQDVEIQDWMIGLVDMRTGAAKGWYNSAESQVVAALDMQRKPGLIVASIFIPLMASLLIPLLAIWLNRTEDGIFQVDTFELVNIIIGGLFAVIALNFTVYSSFTALSVGDNTVNRLFALNYLTLAAALVINILFSRFNVVEKMFGRYVQEQAYAAVMWALPLIVALLVATFMFTAYV
ncbi:hypothetical protein KX729_02565 [Rhizobium sp. XQZ8]|uniref:hypothetical protein n=1 Tax=Rhizobium populisoli TaxID=2859785 RepID=UPI001CA4CF65|nr:hypothetical protein [Rhizobium populisoli]MBW6420312.1 hypothetical protein [Rhizobium populisoli]